MTTHLENLEMIQRQMAAIRQKHHEEVSDVLAGAERMASLERKFRGYSWVAIGAAAVAVCWVAMKRGRTGIMKTEVPGVDVAGSDVDHAGAMTCVTVPIRPGWGSEITSFLTTLAIRAAQNYAIYCVEEWIAPSRVIGPRTAVLDTNQNDPPRPAERTRYPENRTTDNTDKKCGCKVPVGV